MTPRAAQLDRYCALPKPDRRMPWEWAFDAIPELPANYAIKGRFDVRNSPWIRDPMASAVDPLVRHTTTIKSVQSAGTLAMEIIAACRIANNPGPATLTCQTIDMAAKEGKTRFMPLLEATPQIARFLPRPGPYRTTTEIYFHGGAFFIINSANLSDQQSQSVQFKYNDEIFMPQWADVYDDACARVTAFEQQGTSHIYDNSQAGWVGDHADKSFNSGSMEEWGAECFGCGKWMPLHFRQKIDPKDGTWLAGVVWDKAARRSDKTWDETRAAASARFVCAHCGHDHADTDATRARWRKTGRYVSMRENPPRHWKSYHWEAVVAHPLSLLVEMFCKAENDFQRMGDEGPRRKFRQKREARPWEEHRVTLVLGDSDYTLEQYWAGEKVPGELYRFMTVDRQQSHFWVEVRAVTATTCDQLYFDRIDTIDMVRETQLRYKVPDHCVGEDRRYDASKVDADCLRYGWRGMLGFKRKTWTMRNPTTEQLENFPHSDPKFASINGTAVPYYEFSGSHCKDVVANGVKGEGGLRWRTARNANPVYGDHLKAEEKKEIRPGVWEWVEVKQNRNHGFDTSAMLAAILIIAGLVRVKLESEG